MLLLSALLMRSFVVPPQDDTITPQDDTVCVLVMLRNEASLCSKSGTLLEEGSVRIVGLRELIFVI